ncbi:MAG: preprotein translocase subunit Tim44 [Alphaproteobacteria bacterium]|nr:MAG: preprotein translocase subunit Tim44 [Alphaproteobacteria bacterium]
MADGSSWIEIVLLAMLAAFIGLRLVSVLGKRTGHERPVGDSFRPGAPEVTAPASRGIDLPSRGLVAVPAGTDTGLAPALQAVADADSGFDPERFVAGAKAAYGMILESFWSGDTRTMNGLVSDEIQENFATAIEDREGAALPNRVVSIESAAITQAEMIGQMAEVTVRFDARVAIAGGDPISSNDVWTFSRHVGSRDPQWLLIATDDDTPGDGDKTR